MCLPSRCLETALVYSPISQSSHSNGSTPYNIILCYTQFNVATEIVVKEARNINPYAYRVRVRESPLVSLSVCRILLFPKLYVTEKMVKTKYEYVPFGETTPRKFSCYVHWFKSKSVSSPIISSARRVQVSGTRQD
jgi:hypothetical protein